MVGDGHTMRVATQILQHIFGTTEGKFQDLLELLADTGLLGGLCGLSFIGLLFWQGLANLQLATGGSARAIAGSLAACAGLLLHSLVDFNLHIPSNALIFILLASIATAKASKVNGPKLSTQKS